ncbi:E3 ubiquitin-protein ligase E3D [Bombina bombina]|uniref:E3 ubiquitin-protein ligase E3D n=1 Tax=Bombina bombina TaxID=8345 RepID=UPI00235B2861|nr:E3 ubiquitin-protein ligase E3D [Bombina bombina]
MTPVAKGSTVRLEIRKKMQNGILILGGFEGKGFPVDVTVSPSSIQIQCLEGCERICLPDEIKLVPSSCRYLQHIAGEGLHVRLQVQVNCNTEMISTLKEILKVKKNYNFYCQSCGELIIQEQLASLTHIDQFCSICHIRAPGCSGNQGTAEPSISGGPILQEKSKENAKVICRRCKAILGESVSSDSVKYYFTEVLIQPSCQDFSVIPRAQFVESVIVQLLMEFSASRSTFRFCIQGQDGKHFLLLWLLNVDTLMVESITQSGYEKNEFYSDISSLSLTSVEAKNVARVLYSSCTNSKNKELLDKWMNDTGAQALVFPNSTCLELALLLTLNNASLTPSLRFMNNWKVAYLKI